MRRRKGTTYLLLTALGLAILSSLFFTRSHRGLVANDYTQSRLSIRQDRQPIRFYLLVLLLSIPFWLIGGKPLPVPVNLPASALAVFNPLIAASILTWRRDGRRGTGKLWKKAFDAHKIQRRTWYAPIMLLLPFIYSLSYAIMRLARMPLPDPKLPLLMIPAFFVLYFVSAIGEELGWMGYAFEPLQARWGALKASLLLGSMWGIWHVVPDRQAGHSGDWILWQRLFSVTQRILIVSVYNNTGGSVFAAILVHTMDNVSWSLFPNFGSHYNPFFTFTIASVTAILVVWRWGAKTVARPRFAG